MKILKKVLLVILLIIVIAIIGAFIFLNSIKKGALPDYNSEVQIEGLTGQVEVIRDSLAIPHIYASNEKDLYTAVGYTMAQDRLWQMDLLRRVTTGRLSEIFGADMVNADQLLRALRIPEKSEKIIAQSSPEVIDALEAYCAGVNHYINTHPLPPEFKILGYKPEQWEPAQSINLIGYMAWDLTMAWGIEVLLHQVNEEVGNDKLVELIPDLAKMETAIFPDFHEPKIDTKDILLSANKQLQELGIEIFHGSNNWVVSGKKSNTGMPLLANDMHLGLNAPGIWYQMQQVVDGKLNVTGLVLPGQPFVIAGHNDSIAWGMTNVMVDDLDFYLEELSDDTTKYLFNGEWKDLDVRKEKIHIKGGTSVERTNRFNHRGPIVSKFKKIDQAISMRWIGNEMSNEIRSVYRLNHACNWADFKDACSTFIAVSQNIVYADTKGNIGLQTSSGVPIRKGNGIQVYPGQTDEYDWTGLVPFEELPFEFNPERGYVSSANNKTVPDDYPYYISHWFAQTHRINRIRQMLDAKPKLGVEDFEKMHSDFKSNLVEKILPVFLESFQTKNDWGEKESEVINSLKEWDGILTQESIETSVFENLYRKFGENLIKDDLSKNLYSSIKTNRSLMENLILNILSNRGSVWVDDSSTEPVESFDDIAIRALQETITDLSTEFGEDISKWNWGKMHTFTLAHPMGKVEMLDKVLGLNRGPYEMPGSFHTICPYSYPWSDLYHVNHGASHRHIFDASNWDNSKTVIPTGTSGIPASEYYCNQTELYVHNKYHKDYFSRNMVENKGKYKSILKPVSEK